MSVSNVLEMKVEMYELLAQTHDAAIVERIYRKVHEAFDESEQETPDWWDDLSPEQQARLEKSIEESYDPSNWVSHEEVMKKYQKWLKR